MDFISSGFPADDTSDMNGSQSINCNLLLWWLHSRETASKLPVHYPHQESKMTNKYMARRSYSSHIKAYGEKYIATKALLGNFYTPNQTITKHLCVIAKLSLFFTFYFPLPHYPLPLNLESTKNIYCSAWVDIQSLFLWGACQPFFIVFGWRPAS